ncbi:MAG: hypothetical protein AB7K09_10950 [Planctomycetota bacterium]
MTVSTPGIITPEQIAQARSRSRLLDRVAVLVIATAVIILLVLFATVQCDVGGGTPSGPDASNSHPVDPRNDAVGNQPPPVRYPFFAVRFEASPDDPDTPRAAFARLLLPDGRSLPVSGETATGELSQRLFNETLTAKLRETRRAFPGVMQLVLEDFSNQRGLPVFSEQTRRELTAIGRQVFDAAVSWMSTATLERELQRHE